MDDDKVTRSVVLEAAKVMEAAKRSVDSLGMSNYATDLDKRLTQAAELSIARDYATAMREKYDSLFSEWKKQGFPE